MNFGLVFCIVFIVILLNGLLYAIAKIGKIELRIEKLEKKQVKGEKRMKEHCLRLFCEKCGKEQVAKNSNKIVMPKRYNKNITIKNQVSKR